MRRMFLLATLADCAVAALVKGVGDEALTIARLARRHEERARGIAHGYRRPEPRRGSTR